MKKIFGNKYEENVVDRYRLIYAPLIISILGVIVVTVMGYNISKNMIISQLESDGLNLADQAAKQIRGNRESVDAIEDMLEEKIRVSSEWIISERDTLSNERLLEFKRELDIDEIHWIDSEGNTIYTTHSGYKDWVVPEGHPLDVFISSDQRAMTEDIRPDAEYGVPMKYGAVKDSDGYVVQIGIRSETIEQLTNKFGFQNTVAELSDEKKIDYAYMLDKNFEVIADSNKNRLGRVYIGYDEFERALEGELEVREIQNYNSKERVLEIIYPIKLNEDNVIDIAVLGLSMESAYEYIDGMLRYAIIVAGIMIAFILWVQNRNIVVPIKVLHDDIHRINIEKNPEYRLPTFKRDTFNGIVHSINDILEDTSKYFRELERNKKELEESEEVISSAYQQLSASEEELRAQYDEIQNYADKLEDLKKKYEIAIEGTNTAVWEINIEKGTIYFSKEINNIVEGFSYEIEPLESGIEKLFGKTEKKKFMDEYLAYLNGDSEDLYVQLDKKGEDGDKKLLLQGKGIYRKNKLSVISGIILDISKLKEQEDYIEFLAHHDFLTGLPNRRTFLNELNQQVEAEGTGSVMLLDLDNFKEVNDTMGHIYGDRMLEQISERLKDIFTGKGIFISRFGGDEFLLLIPDRTEIDVISEYAERIIDTLKSDIRINGENIYVSCSIGITTYPSDSKSVDQLIMNADMAMYKVKENGKSSYTFFNESMTKEIKEKVEVEREIRNSIENRGFKMVYQPQVSVKTGEVVGYEALIRMIDKPISPGVFIPIAEESGLIIDLGRYVTEEVIREISEWKKNGLKGKRVAINFSAKQLNDKNYITFLKATLSRYEVEASDIEIEVTESVFLDKKQSPIEFLSRLRDIGVRVALDDFGTGYSSLSYLTFLPVDKVKLDKSLSDKFLELENIKTMDSLISLSHSLGLEVIAEGVEDMDQYKRLKVGKCDYIQGYLFSKPLESLDARSVYNTNYLEE